MSSEENEGITEIVQKLERLQKSKSQDATINDTLELLKAECDKGIAQRVAAGKADAYYVLLNIYETFNEKTVQTNTLKTLIALMTMQPDLLDARGVEFIINNLKDQNQDPQLQRLILKWTKECCVAHEMNRQKIFDAHIVDIIKGFLTENTPNEVIREALSVSRALVLDDDIRVEFGKAHEHARVIASETLCAIMSLLSKFKSEEQINIDILLTLTALMVRSEFCKKVDDAGGLELLKSVMETFANSDKIIKNSFKLIKALAGNDECKAHMFTKGFASVMANSLLSSMKSAPAVTAGLAAVAAVTLRNPENANALYQANIADIIVDAMKYYSKEKSVQKAASWAIRNMVSRNKHQSAKFLELGVEELLMEDLKKFKDIEYDVKAALRDLGCNVTLKEEWTGKGGALTTGFRRDND
ncbi:hypothetical protein ABEB36_002601 [Hypothenemus hampei]